VGTGVDEDRILVERGQKFYAEHLRDLLEPERHGELVAIDPETGLYAVGSDPTALLDELDARGSTSPKRCSASGIRGRFRSSATMVGNEGPLR
jgi:hypothetical protein